LAPRTGIGISQATTARAFLRRLRPWLGRAVHVRWQLRRSFYQGEVDALLFALEAEHGRLPPALALRLEGLLSRLHREWFPRTWRGNPTYAEVVRDFRWWLGMAERWSEPPPKAARRRRDPPVPLADQPKRLLSMLGLPPTCTREQFSAAWRRFLKRNHPDVNPDQTPDERRRFAEAVGLWRR
jgi:hypothetical protein